MKKQLLWAALAAVTLLTGCSKDDEVTQDKQGNEVTFVIGGINSRTTTDFTDLSAKFENNDEIGIFGTNLQKDVTNEKLTYTGSNLSSSAIKFKDEETEATFKAYYPWQIENNNIINFAVQKNQSTETAFNASDFLIAKAKGKKGAEISLNFDHKMALVKLTIDEGFTAALQGATITGITLNAIPSATCDFSVDEPTVTVSTDAKENIQMYNNNGTYYCIVPAQNITGDGSTNLLTITTSNNKAFAYKLEENKTISFVEGKTLQITILDGNSFKFYSVSINGWEDITGTDMGVTEQKMSFTATLPNSITTLTTGRNDLTATGWGAYNVTSATITEDATNGNYISVTGAAASGNWSSQGLYYWAGNDYKMSADKTYLLSFKAKSTNNGQISIMVMQKAENKVFPIVDVTTNDINTSTPVGTINSKTLTSEWVTYKFKITPNQTMTGGYGNLNNAATFSGDTDICIAIKGNSNSSPYDIKEVLFEEL